jgi:hypothetical protein
MNEWNPMIYWYCCAAFCGSILQSLDLLVVVVYATMQNWSVTKDDTSYKGLLFPVNLQAQYVY